MGAYEADEHCMICSPGVPVTVSESATLEEVIQELVTRFPDKVEAPSISYQGSNLYMRGVFEEETKVNLGKQMIHLMGGATSGVLTVNDKKLVAPFRIRLSLGGMSDN